MMTQLLRDPVARLVADGFLWVSLAPDIHRAVEAVFEASYPFFRSTADEKLACGLPEDCGYRPRGVEYSQSPDRPDAIESFTACARVPPAEAELVWEVASHLYARLSAVADALEPIAESLAVDMATRLGEAGVGTALRGTLRRWSSVQLNYARPAATREEFLNEEHEDGNLLTLSCATAPGLEIRTRDGRYRADTSATGDMVVMPGEIAYLLSGGRVCPLYHRVRRDPRVVERLALQFFADVSPRVCQPWVRTPVNDGVDIGECVLRNSERYGLPGFSEE